MRKKNDYWMLKIGRRQNPKFVKSKLDWIINERIKIGKNKPADIPKDLNYSRILLAAMRDDQTVNKLINADFIREDKNE